MKKDFIVKLTYTLYLRARPPNSLMVKCGRATAKMAPFAHIPGSYFTKYNIIFTNSLYATRQDLWFIIL